MAEPVVTGFFRVNVREEPREPHDLEWQPRSIFDHAGLQDRAGAAARRAVEDGRIIHPDRVPLRRSHRTRERVPALPPLDRVPVQEDEAIDDVALGDRPDDVVLDVANQARPLQAEGAMNIRPVGTRLAGRHVIPEDSSPNDLQHLSPLILCLGSRDS
jgi:hypothetical protein